MVVYYGIQRRGVEQLTSAAVSSWVSTRGLPLAFLPPAPDPSSLCTLVRERFREGAGPSLSELPIAALPTVCNRATCLVPGRPADLQSNSRTTYKPTSSASEKATRQDRERGKEERGARRDVTQEDAEPAAARGQHMLDSKALRRTRPSHGQPLSRDP